MDSSTLAIIISIAALLFSIVGPVVTALVNGHYRIKEKNLEIKENLAKSNNEYYEMHRTTVIEKFLRTAGSAIYMPSKESFDAFGTASAEIYLYVDEKYWEQIDNLNDLISDKHLESAFVVLQKLTKEFSHAGYRRKKIQIEDTANTTK